MDGYTHGYSKKTAELGSNPDRFGAYFVEGIEARAVGIAFKDDLVTRGYQRRNAEEI